MKPFTIIPDVYARNISPFEDQQTDVPLFMHESPQPNVIESPSVITRVLRAAEAAGVALIARHQDQIGDRRNRELPRT